MTMAGFVSAGGACSRPTFAVVVTQPAPTAPEITGNLLKMRTEYRRCRAVIPGSSRYDSGPAPNLLDRQGRHRHRQTRSDLPDSESAADNKPIEQGGTATFQINVRTSPQIPGRTTRYAASRCGTGFRNSWTCSAVNLSALPSSSSRRRQQPPLPGGSPNATTRPASILKWVFPSPDLDNDYAVDVGQTLSLIYAMKVPDVAAAGTNYANTPACGSTRHSPDIPGSPPPTSPRENIDPTQDANADAPKLIDPSNVFIPGVTVDKDAETSVTRPTTT